MKSSKPTAAPPNGVLDWQSSISRRSLKIGTRLILRRGNALDVLQQQISETGTELVHWPRRCDADAIAQDTLVQFELKSAGITAQSKHKHLLFEPWTPKSKNRRTLQYLHPYMESRARHTIRKLSPPIISLSTPKNCPASDEIKAL